MNTTKTNNATPERVYLAKWNCNDAADSTVLHVIADRDGAPLFTIVSDPDTDFQKVVIPHPDYDLRIPENKRVAGEALRLFEIYGLWLDFRFAPGFGVL